MSTSGGVNEEIILKSKKVACWGNLCFLCYFILTLTNHIHNSSSHSRTHSHNESTMRRPQMSMDPRYTHKSQSNISPSDYHHPSRVCVQPNMNQKCSRYSTNRLQYRDHLHQRLEPCLSMKLPGESQ